MQAIKQMIKAGTPIFCKVTEKVNRTKVQKRKKKQKPTTSQVAKLNERNSIKKLAILLSHNFQDGDYFISLTYSALPLSKEVLRHDLDKFKDRLRYLYGVNNVELKWVSSAETLTQRANFHLVINRGVPIEKIQAIWKNGNVDYVNLNTHGDYRRLAEYMVKESKIYFRTEESICKKRWSKSNSVVMPVTKQEECSSEEFESPKAPEGYYIEKDSIYHGTNPISGRPFTEYVLLPFSHDSSLNGWDNLKEARPIYDGYIKWLREHGEYQLAFELEEEVYGDVV